MSEEEQTDVSAEQRIEAKAKEFGWNPGGDLDAIDFLARGNQFHLDMKGTVDSLKKDNDRVYKIVAEHITATNQKEFQQQQAALDAKIQNAKDDGDTDAAVALAEEKGKLQPPAATDPKAEFLESWVESQPWWSEANMQADAMGFYNAEVYRLKEDDPEKILPRVEARIKELYPNYFTPKNPNRDLPSGDGGAPKGGSSDDGLSLDDLTADERLHIDQFIKMGMKKEKLIESVKNLRTQREV